MKVLLSLAICLMIAGCGGAGTPPVEPVFDVPALVGKDFEGVKAALGEPDEYEEPNEVQKQTLNNWDALWRKDGAELLVTYSMKSGQVYDFFIPTTDESGSTNDEDKLLALGNLSRDDSRYQLDFVRAGGREGDYTGVMVIPN